MTVGKVWYLLLAVVLLMTWCGYAPGLHGGFLFDDFANLPALGAYGPVHTWSIFWRYITADVADPTGRPLTLLSFLLDAHNWPADPLPFKRTNLILHLCNGVLLYLLLVRLGDTLSFTRQQCRLAALFGTAAWLLHPLLVSTTLYIVQREAMLPATFEVAGLLVWLHGRSALAEGRMRVGVFWSITGLGGFTALAVLAKANGALLPLFSLLIELIIMAPRQPITSFGARRAHRAVMLLLARLPALSIIACLAWTGAQGIISGGPISRPWTYGERLLTEPRVLMDYLRLLWLPQPFSSGLFNDQYAASTSLLHPFTTLPSLLAVFGFIAIGWLLRRRHAALSIAILFYFAGQLIESSSIPLELYFEHRNYIPALLMFWPLGLWLADLRTLKMPKRILLVALPLGLMLMTHARADVWGNVQTQALIWAQINPDSARAQANAAQIEMAQGRPQDAIRRLRITLVTQPDQSQLIFNLIGARCMTGGIDGADLKSGYTAMAGTANAGSLFVHWFDRMLPAVLGGGCPGLTAEDLRGLIEAGLHNPKLSSAGPRQDLTYLLGRIALAQHQPDGALDEFIKGLDLQVRPGVALDAAATFGAAGYPHQGLQLLDHYQQEQAHTESPGFGMPMLHAWVLTHQHYWAHELQRMRAQLTLDAAANSHNTVRPVPVHEPSD